MPKIYRAMRDADGKPTIGDGPTDLGVRVPADVQPDTSGKIAPGTGGMSVAPSLADLPTHRLPKRLQAVVPDARGVDTNVIWRMGEGDFVAEAITGDLQLRLDPARETHGFVEPVSPVTLEEYRADLALTRDAWVRDETGQTP